VQTLQSMAHDLSAMGQQVQELKANIAELKAGQDQMTREFAKAQQAKSSEPRAESNAHPKVTGLPPRPPAAPGHRPKPPAAYTPSYATPLSPAPITAAPPPTRPQAAAVPPPFPPPTSGTAEATADDDGPVVRPPMPLR
jgi:hypothetical protein